jgi:heptosyltransferase I
MTSQITKPKSLCILRLSAIGDVCHAVAMVQQIQQYYPKLPITWVVGKIEASLLAGLPGVEFIIFDKKAGWKGYQDLKKQLNGRSFDILLHMQVALRASIASLFIPAKVKIGFDKQRAKEGQWLFTNKKIAAQTDPHVLDGFMGFAQSIGVKTCAPSWLMPITEQDTLWASTHLPTNKPIAVISPAASKAERNWHAQGYAEVADYLSTRGFTIVVCGGPTSMEQQLAKEIIDNAQAEITNLVGKTTLKQLLAVLKTAKLVIAPDTGPAHMAVTVGTPVIGLYAHSNPQRTGPYLYQKYVVSYYQQAIEKQYKKPLAQLPWGLRAKGENLMDNINIAQVRAKVELLINDYYPELA